MLAAKPRISQAMRDIFDAPSREDAEELKGKVVKKFEKIAPEFVSWLEDNLDEGLTVFDFPLVAKDPNHQRTGETAPGDPETNPGVGILSPRSIGADLISAVLAEIHEEWLPADKYLNLAGWKKQVEKSFPTGPTGNYRKTVANLPFREMNPGGVQRPTPRGRSDCARRHRRNFGTYALDAFRSYR